MRNWIPILILLTASILGGCTTHHKMAEPYRNFGKMGLYIGKKQAAKTNQAITEGDISNLLDAEVKAELPATMALAKLRSYWCGGRSSIDIVSAEEINQWEKVLKDVKSVRGIQTIPSLVLENSGRKEGIYLKDLRLAAAKLKCELLLAYVQSESSIANFNDAAALYWTVIGLWLVPGSVLEHRTIMQAVLVDCRTGAILGTATGDCYLKRATPAAFADITRDKLRQEADTKALADLRKGCRKLLEEIVEASEK
ncbi:MAG: hypothetical protein SVT52_00130 [Planctomycetota bacterium]|nr:hypothetical protein [Planctomycetota bacterium]